MGKAAEKIEDLDNETTEETPAQEPEAQETEQPEVPEQVKPAGMNRFALEETKRNRYIVHVPHGTNPKDCLEPDFWVHVAQHLGRGDVVAIMPDDLAWEMSVMVMDRGHNWASVRERSMVEFDTVQVRAETPKTYVIEWAGQTDKFRVTFHGEVLRKGFATEALAQQWANNHAQALKR